MKPEISKLIGYLTKKGIFFISKDGELENVTFRSPDKELKIAHKMFYRQSGLACIHREKTENLIEVIDVTDEMFYNEYMKSILDFHFKK